MYIGPPWWLRQERVRRPGFDPCFGNTLWRRGGTLSAPFWCLCQKLSLSLLYFNKTLLHKRSEWSSLITGHGLNFSPPEAKNPCVFCGSAAIFLLGGSSGILQDKVRMLGALVLCSPSKHVFRCTLLTLRCACVNEWCARHEASEEPCSAVPRWPQTAYGRKPAGGLDWPAKGLTWWPRW